MLANFLMNSLINKFEILVKKFPILLGLRETVYAVAFDAGSSLMGVLFHTLGTQLTLLIYSISSAAVLVMLVLYIRFSTSLHKYEKVAQDSDVE